MSLHVQQALLSLLYLILYSMICCISQYTSITGIWPDDFSDNTPLPGWSYTDSHSINTNDPYTLGNKEYHGPYIGRSPGGTTYLFTIEQQFKCTKASSVSVNYNFFGCDTGSSDFTRLVLDGTTYSISGYGGNSYSDAILTAATPDCNQWKEFGPLPTYTISSVAAGQLFTVKFQSKVTNYDEAMAISSIQITCNAFPTPSPTSNPTQNPINTLTDNPTTSSPTDSPTFNPITSQPTTNKPTTATPTTSHTSQPSSNPSISPTTSMPTTFPSFNPTTHVPTTHLPTTHEPTTYEPTTHSPTTHKPTTSSPTGSPTFNPITSQPTTNQPTTAIPTTSQPSSNPSISPTTSIPTTNIPITSTPTIYNPTSVEPSMDPSITPTTSIPTDNPSLNPTTTQPTTAMPTTSEPTTKQSSHTSTVPGVTQNSSSNPTTDTETKLDSFNDPGFQQKLIIILLLILIICCMAISLFIVKTRKFQDFIGKRHDPAPIKDVVISTTNGVNNNTSSTNTMVPPQLDLKDRARIHSNSVHQMDTMPGLQKTKSLSDEMNIDHIPHSQMTEINTTDINIYDSYNKNDEISPTHDTSIERLYELKRISSLYENRQTPGFPKWGEFKKEKTDLSVYKMEGVYVDNKMDNNNQETSGNITKGGDDNINDNHMAKPMDMTPNGYNTPNIQQNNYNDNNHRFAPIDSNYIQSQRMNQMYDAQHIKAKPNNMNHPFFHHNYNANYV